MIPKRFKPVAEWLDGIGATDVHIGKGGKHPRIIFDYDGRQRYLSLPGSPSDSMRGARNTIMDLRRMLGLQGKTAVAVSQGAAA